MYKPKVYSEKEFVERLQTIDKKEAKRYRGLPSPAQAIARIGIQERFRRCDRLNLPVGGDVVREIIEDARNRRAVYAEVC